MDELDTRPPAVREAAKTPGMYLFSGGSMFFFEVDEAGVLHQLTFKFERDGELTNYGWAETPATQGAAVYRLERVLTN